MSDWEAVTGRQFMAMVISYAICQSAKAAALMQLSKPFRFCHCPFLSADFFFINWDRVHP